MKCSFGNDGFSQQNLTNFSSNSLLNIQSDFLKEDQQHSKMLSTSSNNKTNNTETLTYITGISRQRNQSFAGTRSFKQKNKKQQKMNHTVTDKIIFNDENLSENVPSDDDKYDSISQQFESTRKSITQTSTKAKLIQNAQSMINDQTPSNTPLLDIDQNSIMKNLFYLKNTDNQRLYQNNVATIKHKQLEYQCINQYSQTQNMIIDFIKIKEMNNKNKKDISNNEENQKRSLIYISQFPWDKISQSEDHKINLNEEVRKACQQQQYQDFEQMYNSLTEKLINSIIDNEYDIKAQQSNCHMQNVSKPQSYLLIGQQSNNHQISIDTNIETNASHKATIPITSRQVNINLNKLNQETEIKQKKIMQMRELRIQQYQQQKMQECTFKPNLTSLSKQDAKLRSPQQFYNDMIQFQEKVNNDIITKRLQEEIEIKAKVHRKTDLDNNSRDNLFDRLHLENLKKSKEINNNESTPVIHKTPTRKADDVVQHLYTDFFLREQKLKNLQLGNFLNENKENQQALDFSRSNQVLANKIFNQVQFVYQEMDLKDTDLLNFFNLVEVLTKLGYVNQMDENEKVLMNQIWQIIVQNPKAGNEMGFIQRNLITFLLALDNLFIDQMQAYPCANKSKKQFGYFIGDYLFFDDENDVKRLHIYFLSLYKNKLERKILSKRDSMSPVSQFKFSPQVNPKSLLIAQDSLKKLECAIQLGTGNPSAKLKYEDLLISKGKVSQEKIKLQQAWKEENENEGCTFSPQIYSNLSSKNLLKRKSRNVFENLYDKAKTQQQKKTNLMKLKQEIEQNTIQEDCTFRPNLTKTQRQNSQTQSRLNNNPSYKQIFYQTLNNNEHISPSSSQERLSNSQQRRLTNSQRQLAQQQIQYHTNQPNIQHSQQIQQQYATYQQQQQQYYQQTPKLSDSKSLQFNDSRNNLNKSGNFSRRTLNFNNYLTQNVDTIYN